MNNLRTFDASGNRVGFPSTNCIIPPSFFNRGGLAGFLNGNVTWKHYFVNSPTQLPYFYNVYTVNNDGSTIYNPAYPPNLYISSTYPGYNVETVPVQLCLTNLSQYQSLQSQAQIDIFKKVYNYNSNAYVNYKYNNGGGPIYYSYKDYAELNNYKEGVRIINDLYDFDLMAHGTNEYGSTLGWFVPFLL
jgi:hypothetical protein